MGRPPKKITDAENAVKSGNTPMVGIRMATEMRAELEKFAKNDGRTLSGLILKILSDWLKDAGKK